MKSLSIRLRTFLSTLYTQRGLIKTLAWREVQAQYQGSFLGFLWAIINPLVMIILFWFVFSVGFRAQPMNDTPFVVWLTAGLSIWMFFSESVLGSAEVIVHNAPLIKKTLFKSQILPIIKILAALVTHAVFVLILIGLLCFEGLPFSFYFFQSIYYLFCTMVLALAFSWFFSAITVFVRDFSKFLALFMQIGFWSTPIFWDLSIMSSPKVHSIMQFNPFFYLVQGYRDSFLNFHPFWYRLDQTLFFWVFTLTFLLIGAVVFQRLKSHFPDVL